MGGPRCRGFLPVYALCVLLTLLEGRFGNTSASATEACARWCPSGSTCVNATACRCAPGFTSSVGEIFTSPDEYCDDINECGPPPTVSCGQSADCQNTEGSYFCTCNPGYKLVSGGTVFRNESENTCQDTDECQLNPGICKNRSVCVNTQGSYTCRCPPGLELNPEDPKLCKDVNECTSEQNPCHKSTHCLNIVGSYKCRCRPGWKPIPGSPNGPNTTICEDVDECRSSEHHCDNSTFCNNILGSYTCHCRQGWVPKPGFQNKQKTTQCEEVSFPTWTPPPGIKSQSLSHFFKEVQDLGRKFKSASAQDTIQKLIESLDNLLLKVPGELEVLGLRERYCTATHLLSGLENVLRTLAKAMPGTSFTYHSSDDTELSLMIQEQGNGNVTIGQSHARMHLNWTKAAGVKDSGPMITGMLSSKTMQKLLEKAPLKVEPEKNRRPINGTQPSLVSAVNTVFLSNTETKKLPVVVTFAFSHTEKPGPQQKLICAFWNEDNESGGYWNTTGCQKLGSLNDSTTCQCNHLSSFAILMAHYDVQDPKLALITQVGLVLSLVCLLLCILTFLLVRPIQGSRTTVHLHLCICLFVGSAIFLAGIKNEVDHVETRCRLVAGLLHYWFLAAFCWMSLEGLELYFLVVRVFQGQGLSKRWLCLIGYGVPGLIVAISAAANIEGYGYHPDENHDGYCWLDTKAGFLWSFLGPVTFIILCNAVIFVITVWKLTQKFSEINPDMKKLKKARALTITAMAQLFLLGCTWVFGLFLFDPVSWVLAYIFSILNCLQGLFLFLLHCLLNKKVREEYRKWAGMVTGNKYSEFTTSTSGSSHNQTRVLRPSESGM